MSDPSQPLRIAYDLSRMTAGGGHGGIKTHHYEFLRHFAVHHAGEIEFSVFCQAELAPELAFLAASGFHQIHVLGPRAGPDPRGLEKPLPPLRYWPELPENLLAKLGIDLLYCGFGVSPLHSPQTPQISLLVDVLHRDLPESLPKGEVPARERWYRQAIEQADLIQTNSDFCVASLQRHYGIDPAKLLRIELPLHGRFHRFEQGPLPERLRGRDYFFYPANHWPHKNHRTLLVAYRQYLQARPDSAWDLVLTGGEGEQAAALAEASRALGLEARVHFLGHLSEPVLKAVWEHCRALAFPSLYEGFGLPLLEAMHFQKPIIAGKLASIPEICGDSIRYCDPRRPDDLARALAETETADLPRQQYADILPRFDLAAAAQRLLDAMRQVADRPKLPSQASKGTAA